MLVNGANRDIDMRVCLCVCVFMFLRHISTRKGVKYQCVNASNTDSVGARIKHIRLKPRSFV